MNEKKMLMKELIEKEVKSIDLQIERLEDTGKHAFINDGLIFKAQLDIDHLNKRKKLLFELLEDL